jgi:hypothetical protein
MSGIGYTIVEPDSLGKWLGNVTNRPTLLALLTWLKHQLSDALRCEFPALKIEVIRVDYFGAYPAFGLQGDEDVPPDFDERLNGLVMGILSGSSIADFLDSFAIK